MKKLIYIILIVNLFFFGLGIGLGYTIFASLMPLISQLVIVAVLGLTYDRK